MKYELDDRPGLVPLLLYGLQWWVVSLPSVVIMGAVVSRLHYPELAQQTVYLQKLFALMGIGTVVQVLFGHRLPLVIGPATILVVGLVAAQSAGVPALYTAIMVGGAVLCLAAFTGLLTRIRFFFTPRIIAVILVLIAFTLTPTILRLLLGSGQQTTFHLAFGLVTVLALAVCNTVLPGVLKSLTVLIGIAGGSLAYFLFLGFPGMPQAGESEFSLFVPALEFHPGVILSFLFCFLALTVNELGSIESVGHMLRADAMDGRIRRGVGLQGIGNIAAGGLGIIGPVDYSLSAGVIAGTGCASRYTLVPAGLGLFLCAFFPQAVMVLAAIPGPVMGALMFYLMASQLATGLSMLVAEKGVTDFNSGLIVSLPLMTGLVIGFAPATAFLDFPEVLRPILGNGFVMGTLLVILLEHVIFRHAGKKSEIAETS